MLPKTVCAGHSPVRKSVHRILSWDFWSRTSLIKSVVSLKLLFLSAALFLFKFCKRKSIVWLSIILIQLLLTPNILNGQTPQGVTCVGANCTSKDVRIAEVKLVRPDGSDLPNSCPANQSFIPVALKFRMTTNATRYGIVVIADVF